VTCTEAQLKAVTDGKKTTVSGYEVVLEDTILFPEGGGQVYLIHFIYPCHSYIFLIR
jgi:Ser-tRNA(Ala) deacylase AlaX